MPVGFKDIVNSASLPALNTSSRASPASQFSSELFYNIRPGNWYKTFPFYFEIIDENAASTQIKFFLPIPPQNLTVQDLSASEAHATIGGVVEETTHGVFSIVTLTGTTGLSASATDLSTSSSEETLVVAYRKYLDDLTGQSNPISKLIGNVVGGVTNLAANLLGDAEAELPYQSAGSAVGSTNASNDVVIENLSIGGSGATRKSGFSLASVGEKLFKATLGQFTQDKGNYKTPFANGYSWSHALRQMFLIYQREKSKNQNLALYFNDSKANTSYRCVVRSAQFTQNAKDPYLINYNISLKCWDVTGTTVNFDAAEIDRFGENGDLKEVYTANITASITSVGNTIRNFRRPGGVAGAMVKNSTSSII